MIIPLTPSLSYLQIFPCTFWQISQITTQNSTLGTSKFWDGLTSLGSRHEQGCVPPGVPRREAILGPAAASADPCSSGCWFPVHPQASDSGLLEMPVSIPSIIFPLSFSFDFLLSFQSSIGLEQFRLRLKILGSAGSKCTLLCLASSAHSLCVSRSL